MIPKEGTYNFAKVLEEEGAEINLQCAGRGVMDELLLKEKGPVPDRFGLAFSGGGIRSACVGLGITQSLAKNRLLLQAHYISGISGGSWFVGWLTAWIKREGEQAGSTPAVADNAPPPEGFRWTRRLVPWLFFGLLGGVAASLDPKVANGETAGPAIPDRSGAVSVEDKLAWNTESGKKPDTPHPPGYNRFLEPEAVHQLRRYSSFLTPRMGLFSGDTLAAISIYLRNVLLNQVMLAAALVAITLVLQLAAPKTLWPRVAPLSWRGIAFFALPIGVCFALGVGMAVIALRKLDEVASEPGTSSTWGRYRRKAINALRKFGAGDRSQLPSKLSVAYWSSVAADTLASLDGDAAEPPGKLTAWIAYWCGMAGCLLAWLMTPAFFLHASSEWLLKVIVFVLWLVGIVLSCGAIRRRKSAEASASIQAKVGAAKHVGTANRAVNRSGRVIGWSVFCAWTACAFLTYGFDVAFRYWLQPVSLLSPLLLRDSYVILGYPAILICMTLVSYLFIGIMGDALPDNKREWLARIFGYFTASACVLALVLAIMLEGPMLMQWLIGTIRSGGWHGALAAVMPGGWAFLVVTGVLGGKSSKTGAATSSSKASDDSGDGVLSWLVMIAPPVFLTGVLLIASWGTHRLVISAVASPLGGSAEYLTHYAFSPRSLRPATGHAQQLPQIFAGSNRESGEHGMSDQHPLLPTAVVTYVNTTPFHRALGGAMLVPRRAKEWLSAHRYLAFILAAFLLAGILALRLDVNEFSMHLFLRNRLVRAFLGASNPRRVPSKFTGFAQDDIPLDEMINDKHYDGPYPLFGTTLNLTGGEDLAWQQRKGASFLYSPLFSGWDYVPSTGIPLTQEKPRATQEKLADKKLTYGYRTNLPILDKYDETKVKVSGYGGPGGKPFLGTAMAASGAAASPNMGYHTNAGVAALMAVFNVRLGWWTGNPRHPKKWQSYAPWVGYLLKELTGSTDDQSGYVYLSDGGHFENLGIYELVRRRVRFILCSDADADKVFSFEDLGNAVERCRRDFGVEIDIRATRDFKSDPDSYRAGHYAIGAIKYPGQEQPGVLLYIKSSLNNDEPADVLAIRSQHKDFPHDSTGNQFFDEPLFEAYRALGEHMMDSVLECEKVKFELRKSVSKAERQTRVACLFQTLKNKVEEKQAASAAS